jgi:anthranilate/para-aminobenzoate synthase component II
MLLMIDNYDSFTYNLVQYFGELGETVTTIRNDQATLAELIELNPDHVVISPGPCDPDQAGISLQVIEALCRKSANPRGLFGSPGDWTGIWRTNYSCPESHAW